MTTILCIAEETRNSLSFARSDRAIAFDWSEKCCRKGDTQRALLEHRAKDEGFNDKTGVTLSQDEWFSLYLRVLVPPDGPWSFSLFLCYYSFILPCFVFDWLSLCSVEQLALSNPHSAALVLVILVSSITFNL